MYLMHEFYEQNYACLFNNKQFSDFQVSYFEIYMDKIRDLLDGKWESANCWLEEKKIDHAVMNKSRKRLMEF